MKNRKEKASGLSQWLQGRDVSIRYLIPFIIIALVIIAWNIINIYFNSFKIDDTSAHYLLSALVQSLAAIIAIVVTLTLVAVQLAASAYSPRVIDIFKKDRVMWLLLVWYGLSIFFGLFVLEVIGSTHSNSWCIAVPLEILVLLVYLMGIAAFAGLFWHIGNVIDLLNPENIIERLALEIKEDTILNPEKHPIQPIMDTIHGAVMKYDIATTRIGLKVVTNQVIEIIKPDSQKEDSKKKISKCFCHHLEQVGRLTVSKMDEESTRDVIENLYNFGRWSSENRLGDATRSVAESLGLIGKLTAEKEKGLEEVTSQAVQSLRDVGKCAAKNQLKDAMSQAVASLGDVGTSAVENGLEDVVLQVRDSLELVEMAAKDNNLTIATKQKVESLKRFGETVAGKGDVFEDVTIQMVEYIRGVGESAAEDEDNDLIKYVVDSLVYIGKTAVEQKLKGATEAVILSIGLAGVAAAKKEPVLEDVTKHAIKCLNHITESTRGVEFFKMSTEQTAKFCIWIGVFAIEKGLDDVVGVCANCFVGWTLSCEKLERQKLFHELFRDWKINPAHRKFAFESASKFEERCEKLRTRTQNRNPLRTRYP